MNNLFKIFSTREVSLVIWFIVFLFFVSRSKDVRHSIVGVIKAFFARKLIVAFSTLLLYILFIVAILSYIDFWDITLLKDTLLWILFSGIVLYININTIENVNYFSKLIKDNIKIIAIWEFLFSFYTLSLVWELVLIPAVFMFSVIEVFAENSSKQEESHKKVAALCKNLLVLVGLVMIGYVIYRTITEYELLLSISNLKSFLLPIILIILTLPYFYVLALYMNYESFITVVKRFHRNEDPRIIKELIKATLKYANVNINTIKRIWKYQVHFNSSKESPDEYIKRVAKKPKHIISDKARLPLFNDIQAVIKKLSDIGIGKLDEWHKSYAGDDYYLSMTNYYQFGIDDITKIPNALAFYLTGEKTYIKRLEVVLDIGYEQNKYQAIEKFTKVLRLTFSSLDIPFPEDLTNSIIEDREYNLRNNAYSISLNYEKFEIIEKYTINVTTEIN